jgi:hypothetical protein
MTHYLLWLALGAGPISVCPCARPRRPSARASNPQAPQHLCPCVALTECLHPGHEPPAGLPPFALGISPITLFHCREGRRGKRGEEEGAPPPHHAGETGAPPVSKKPEPRRDRSGTTTQGGRSRARTPPPAPLHRAIVFPEPATTTPPTQCERRRSRLYLSPSLVSPCDDPATSRHVVVNSLPVC